MLSGGSEAHWRKVNPLTFDKPDKQPGDVSRVAVYDKELRDGHALAAAILSHAPFLATAQPGIVGGTPREGTAIDALHRRPCAQPEAIANLNWVLEALETLGMPFTLGGDARLSAAELYAAPERDLCSSSCTRRCPPCRRRRSPRRRPPRASGQAD